MAADTLYVGFWTDKGKADADTLDFLQQLRGKRVFLFGTAGFGGSAPYFEKILAATRKALDGSNTVIGSFMCQGKMPVSVRQRYEAMKAKPLHIPNLDALIENFDKAVFPPGCRRSGAAETGCKISPRQPSLECTHIESITKCIDGRREMRYTLLVVIHD